MLRQKPNMPLLHHKQTYFISLPLSLVPSQICKQYKYIFLAKSIFRYINILFMQVLVPKLWLLLMMVTKNWMLEQNADHCLEKINEHIRCMCVLSVKNVHQIKNLGIQNRHPSFQLSVCDRGFISAIFKFKKPKIMMTGCFLNNFHTSKIIGHFSLSQDESRQNCFHIFIIMCTIKENEHTKYLKWVNFTGYIGLNQFLFCCVEIFKLVSGWRHCNLVVNLSTTLF